MKRTGRDTRQRRGMRSRSALLAAAAAIAGAVACGTADVTHPTTPQTGSTASAAPQGDSLCRELNGTVGPDRDCHVHSAAPTYTIDMTFPLDYPDMRAVTGFLKQDRDNFVGWVGTFGPRDGRGRAYRYTVTAKTYRSGRPDAGTRSLVLKIDNDTGYANEGHADTTFRAFNFDLANHAAITFDTLFKPGTKPLDVLNPIVRGDLDAPSADLDETTYRNFALTDDAVIFFFGQNQVVRDNAGPHRVTVPRSALAPLLA
jgi:Protein of unknown function (DUF3298)